VGKQAQNGKISIKNDRKSIGFTIRSGSGNMDYGLRN